MKAKITVVFKVECFDCDETAQVIFDALCERGALIEFVDQYAENKLSDCRVHDVYVAAVEKL